MSADDTPVEPVTVRRYLWPYEAQVARSVLESDGIPAVVQNLELAQLNWLYVQAIGGLRLQVSSDDAARAAELLDAFESTPATADDGGEEACPACGGLAQERVVSGRVAMAATWLILGFPLWRLRKTTRCASCKRPLPAAPESPGTNHG